MLCRCATAGQHILGLLKPRRAQPLHTEVRYLHEVAWSWGAGLVVAGPLVSGE